MIKKTLNVVQRTRFFVGMTKDEVIDWLAEVWEAHMEQTGGSEPLRPEAMPETLCVLLELCPFCLSELLDDHGRYTEITGVDLRDHLRGLFNKYGPQGLTESPFPSEREPRKKRAPMHTH